MATPDASPEAGGPDALRAEHDALAVRLHIRRSVDALRSAAYTGFASLLTLGLSLKFAWDRWGWGKAPRPPVRGKYPLLFLAAVVAFAVLAALTVRALRRSSALRAEEDRLYARFRELRKTLRLDP